MKKRGLSILLVLALSFGSSIQVFALENQVSVNDSTIHLQSIGHGEFRLIDNITPYAFDKDTSLTLTATPTKDKEILYVSGNQYLVETPTGTYLMVDKVDVNINDVESHRNVFNEYAIPEASIDEMKNIISDQKALGNNDFYIELYVPSSISPYGATTTSATRIHKDKNGTSWTMRDIITKYSNLNTGMLNITGANAHNAADSTVNLLISAVGLGSTAVGILGLGKSLYDDWKSRHGIVDGASNDVFSVALIYDRIESRTQYYAPGMGKYVDGKTSHKVWLNRLDVYQCYSGISELTKPTLNRIFYSQYWEKDDYALALAGFEDYLKAKVYTKTVILNGRS